MKRLLIFGIIICISLLGVISAVTYSNSIVKNQAFLRISDPENSLIAVSIPNSSMLLEESEDPVVVPEIIYVITNNLDTDINFNLSPIPNDCLVSKGLELEYNGYLPRGSLPRSVKIRLIPGATVEPTFFDLNLTLNAEWDGGLAEIVLDSVSVSVIVKTKSTEDELENLAEFSTLMAPVIGETDTTGDSDAVIDIDDGNHIEVLDNNEVMDTCGSNNPINGKDVEVITEPLPSGTIDFSSSSNETSENNDGEDE